MRVRDPVLLRLPIYVCSEDEHYQRDYAFPWDYNQVIGWIEVEVRGNALRARKWMVLERPSRRLRRKTFRLVDPKVFHVQLWPGVSSRDIYEEFLGRLEALQRSYRPWHLDLEDFRSIGRYVDWCALIQELG